MSTGIDIGTSFCDLVHNGELCVKGFRSVCSWVSVFRSEIPYKTMQDESEKPEVAKHKVVETIFEDRFWNKRLTFFRSIIHPFGSVLTGDDAVRLYREYSESRPYTHKYFSEIAESLREKGFRAFSLEFKSFGHLKDIFYDYESAKSIIPYFVGMGKQISLNPPVEARYLVSGTNGTSFIGKPSYFFELSFEEASWAYKKILAAILEKSQDKIKNIINDKKFIGIPFNLPLRSLREFAGIVFSSLLEIAEKYGIKTDISNIAKTVRFVPKSLAASFKVISKLKKKDNKYKLLTLSFGTDTLEASLTAVDGNIKDIISIKNIRVGGKLIDLLIGERIVSEYLKKLSKKHTVEKRNRILSLSLSWKDCDVVYNCDMDTTIMWNAVGCNGNNSIEEAKIKVCENPKTSQKITFNILFYLSKDFQNYLFESTEPQCVPLSEMDSHSSKVPQIIKDTFEFELNSDLLDDIFNNQKIDQKVASSYIDSAAAGKTMKDLIDEFVSEFEDCDFVVAVGRSTKIRGFINLLKTKYKDKFISSEELEIDPTTAVAEGLALCEGNEKIITVLPKTIYVSSSDGPLIEIAKPFSKAGKFSAEVELIGNEKVLHFWERAEKTFFWFGVLLPGTARSGKYSVKLQIEDYHNISVSLSDEKGKTYSFDSFSQEEVFFGIPCYDMTSEIDKSFLMTSERFEIPYISNMLGEPSAQHKNGVLSILKKIKDEIKNRGYSPEDFEKRIWITVRDINKGIEFCRIGGERLKKELEDGKLFSYFPTVKNCVVSVIFQPNWTLEAFDIVL